MKVFAVSDLHLDYAENRSWFDNLSRFDYQNDLLIIAGDVSDSRQLLEKALVGFRERFWEVFFVPGNHDLWVLRNPGINSLEKFENIKAMADDNGIRMEPARFGFLSIVPLFSWYDYSFGQPGAEIRDSWMDPVTCKWPAGFDEARITQYFLDLNEAFLGISNRFIITFSHFLPRIDLMPAFVPWNTRNLFPVLGTRLLEQQIRKIAATIHVYGHSHLNRQTEKNGILYINNAFGYPHELDISVKNLKCIFQFQDDGLPRNDD